MPRKWLIFFFCWAEKISVIFINTTKITSECHPHVSCMRACVCVCVFITIPPLISRQHSIYFFVRIIASEFVKQLNCIIESFSWMNKMTEQACLSWTNWISDKQDPKAKKEKNSHHSLRYKGIIWDGFFLPRPRMYTLVRT